MGQKLLFMNAAFQMPRSFPETPSFWQNADLIPENMNLVNATEKPGNIERAFRILECNQVSAGKTFM